jgi:hypothetical protein
MCASQRLKLVGDLNKRSFSPSLGGFAASVVASEIAHAYSFLTRCKNSVKKRQDRSAACTLGCKDMVCPNLPAGSAVCRVDKTLDRDLDRDLFGICRDFPLVSAYASYLTAARPL